MAETLGAPIKIGPVVHWIPSGVTIQRMNFRIKCAMQHALDVLPGGNYLHYAMQRFVTKTLPTPDSNIQNCRNIARDHLRNYAALGSGKPNSVLDFGCGFDLSIPVLFGQAGCDVLAVDIERHATPFLIDNMLRRLSAESLEASRVEYRAPCDVRSTGLADGSFDMITSTAVLEHVPASDIPSILAECKRLLRPRGICSFWIDYRDHWAYFDRRLPWNHFLRYSDTRWRMYNPPSHYQNRLRHSDYLSMFREAGLNVAWMRPETESAPTLVDARFHGKSREDLAISNSWFVLVHT